MASFRKTQEDHDKWERLVENAVGAHFLNNMGTLPYRLFYWRKGNFEVDFVLALPAKIIAVEVKSSRMKKPRGLEKFLQLYPNARPLIIGGSGMALEKFFITDLSKLIDAV